MNKPPIRAQVISGLWLTAKILLAFFTGTAFVGGLVVLRRPDPNPASVLARHSPIPWVIVAMATVILIWTIDRWRTILPGILAYGALGGLIMLASGEYNKVPVPRLVALALTLFMIASSVVTLTFSRRDLSLIDRIALMAFVFCLALGVTPDIFEMTVALGIGLCLLPFAWAVDHIQRSGGHKSSQDQQRGSASSR
jgi:hypothetical protein